MGNVQKFIDQMRYWCDHGNLGYDQSNRWDIRYGGECDCSSLIYWCLWESGFLEKPKDSPWNHTLYTGTLRHDLLAAGWTEKPNNGNPKPGSILLNERHHVVACTDWGKVSGASIDENGRAAGGKSGDQTDRETRTQPYYNYPWDHYYEPPEGSKIVSGWKQNKDGWWYQDEDGSWPHSTWRKINDKWYLFDRDGYAMTGWQKSSGNWYYLYTLQDNRTECAMATGWVRNNGKWYYLRPTKESSHPEGSMVASEVRLIDGKWYAFDASGAMRTTPVAQDASGALILG